MILTIKLGTGKPVASTCAARGHHVHGIDFSPVMISISRRQVPAATFQCINMLDFNPSYQYDAVYAIFSLFLTTREDLIHVAKKWKHWVKPGGWLFVGIMVADDLPTADGMFYEDGLCARDIESTFMGNRVLSVLYTRKGWEVLLKDVGFEVFKTETISFQAPEEARCDRESRYYITARNVAF